VTAVFSGYAAGVDVSIVSRTLRRPLRTCGGRARTSHTCSSHVFSNPNPSLATGMLRGSVSLR